MADNRWDLVTRVDEKAVEPMSVFAGETKDIIIVLREVAHRMVCDNLRQISVTSAKGGQSLSITMKR